MTIDPTIAVSLGAEWQIAAASRASMPEPPTRQAGTGLRLDARAARSRPRPTARPQAAEAAQALATGQAADPTAVVMAVERAQLAMQIASQIRTKAVEAAQTIFQTQV